MQKAGLLLCATVFLFASATTTAANEGGDRTIEVTRTVEGATSDPWRFDVSPELTEAIGVAAETTGVDFEYLVKTAALESSFRETLEASTSSAAGLYQFIERTWLFMVREHGAEAGIAAYAAAIIVTDAGECQVEDNFLRDEILALRGDPALSALMAGAFARRNGERMAKRLGRAPDAVELYIGHLFGASGGARLIELAESRPDERASRYFRSAARANRAIFHNGRKPRSLGEVRAYIADKYAAISIRPAGEAEQGIDTTDLPLPLPAPRSPIRLAGD